MTSSRSWTESELRSELDRYESELRDSGKARNSINTYVQHPERFINWLVGTYDPGPPADTARNSPASRGSKYAPLRTYLSERDEPVVTLTFAAIESIIDRPLPASARKYRPWWANEQDGTHVHARAWLDAERRTANVDLNAGTVDFIR